MRKCLTLMIFCLLFAVIYGAESVPEQRVLVSTTYLMNEGTSFYLADLDFARKHRLLRTVQHAPMVFHRDFSRRRMHVFRVRLFYKVTDTNTLLDTISELFSQPEMYPGLLSCKAFIAESKIELTTTHPNVYNAAMKFLNLGHEAIISSDHERNSLIPLMLFEPETQKALPNEKLWLVSRVCPTCYSQLYINERFLANQLYHFNPEALCSHFRLVRTLNPPTDMSLDGRVTITSTFNHAVVDTKVAYQIYARAVAALFKNAMEVTEFGGFKFFPGLNYLEAMEFSHTPRTDGNKDLSVKLIFAKGMDKEHCSSLDYHIKVLFMSMTLYEEVSLGISPEPEPCKLSYDNQDYPVDSASGLSALLTTLIDLDAYSRRGKPILIENKTAGMTSAFANSAQRYIVAADFRLNRTGAIPLLILKLYEFLSMAIIHKNVEISVVLGQYIPVRHFIQFFMLHPCGCSNYSLNFSLALPDAQLGMTKAVCLRTVFEVLLRGLDASEIKVSVGQMDEAPNLSVSFFNLKAPVDPKKFRYNSVIYTPTPAKVQKNAANTMKQPTRKELLRIAQNESRRIKREVQKNQSQTASKPAAVPPPQAQEPYHTESKDTVQSSDATAPVKLDAGPHSPELNTQPEPKLSLAAGSAQPLTSGSVDESKAKEQTDNTVESPSPVTLSNVEHLPFEMKIAVEKEPEKPTILVKEEPVDMGTCSLNPIGCQHVKPLAESREHILQVKSLQLKSTASRPTHRDRLRIPVSFK